MRPKFWIHESLGIDVATLLDVNLIVNKMLCDLKLTLCSIDCARLLNVNIITYQKNVMLLEVHFMQHR